MDEILSKNTGVLTPSFEYYFFHPEKLLELYRLKTNSIHGDSSYDGPVLLKIDVIENEVIKLISKDERNLSVVEKRLIDNVRRFYLNFYNKSLPNNYKMVASYASCKVFNQPYRNKLFNKDICVNITSYNNQLIKFVNDTYNKFCKGQKVDETALNIMFEYYSGKITVDMSDKYKARCDFLVKKLLNWNGNYPTSGKNFLLQYFSYKKCMDEHKPLAKVYLSSKAYDGSMLSSSTLGVSYGFTGVVFINDNFAKLHPAGKAYHGIDNDFNLIAVLFHELQHFSQSLDADRGVVSASAMKMIKSNLFRNYLSSKEFNEYQQNYDYRETEVEADYQGYKDAFMYLNSLVPKRVRELAKARERSNKMKNKSAFSFQFYENGLKTYIENYNVKMLCKIISKNPRLLNDYPQLKLFFNGDGSYKGFERLISEYTQAKLSGKSDEYLFTYNEFFLIEFKNRLSNGYMDLSNIRSDDDLFTVFSLVADLFTIETTKLSRMIDGVNNQNLDLFNKIAPFRVDRIIEYYNFITSNSRLIESLIAGEKRTKTLNPARLLRSSDNMETSYLNARINYLKRMFVSNGLVSSTTSAFELNNLQLKGGNNYGR